jgi:hypothetical protein
MPSSSPGDGTLGSHAPAWGKLRSSRGGGEVELQCCTVASDCRTGAARGARYGEEERQTSGVGAPRLHRDFILAFLEDEEVGAVVFGVGTRPWADGNGGSMIQNCRRPSG